MPDSPMRTSTVLSLFPTLVWQAEVADDLRARVEAAALGKLGEMAPAPGRSWQSEQTLHRLPEFAELVTIVRRMTTAVLEFLRVGHQGFEITGCWANVSAPGAAHPIHHHPNNFLSGVYYLRVAEGADTIHFHDPRPQARIIRPPVRELAGENTDLVVVRVQPGTLLLFPAWLEHSVPPNRSAQARVSVSFNVMFSQYTETMARPMWEPGER